VGIVNPYDEFDFFPDHPIGDFTVADESKEKEIEKKIDEDLDN
tara:strand:- start:4629 stop:4757 length:129 start_codon:yes stop_codon:yes gene_type:complete